MAHIEPHAPCVVCGGPVLRGKTSITYWREQKTCGRVCGLKYQHRAAHARMAQAASEHAPCKNPKCRAPVVPHKGEQYSHYVRRAYCSRPCADADGRRRRRNFYRSSGAKPKIIGKHATIESYLAAGNQITVLPPAYAAPTRAALKPAEERRRIERITVEPLETWRQLRERDFR